MVSNATELLRRADEICSRVWDPKAEKLSEDIRAFLAAEPEAEPMNWPIDREWLRSVLRFAEKNPDYFYDVEPGFISLDSGDTDTIITALNKSAELAIRKPMTEEEIKAEAQSEKFNRCDAIVFAVGVRFAERHHGIGGDDVRETPGD